MALYAIHSSLDNASNIRVGVKISEYLYYSKQKPLPSMSAYASPADLFLREFNQLKMEVLRRVTDINTVTGRVTAGKEVTFDEAVALLQADSANIIADTKKEAQNLGYKAWGKLTKPETHFPKTGRHHFHDVNRSYKSHVFY